MTALDFTARGMVRQLDRNLASTAPALGAHLIGAAGGGTVLNRLHGYASRSEIAGLTPTNGDRVFLREAGRAGQFVFDASDLSAEVAADTVEAVYIAPDSDPDGSSGAWVRQYDGRIFLEWGGFAESNTAAQNRAIMRAMLDLGPCTCGPGDFPLEDLLWKSGDDFWGCGKETHFVAGSGIVMKFGCMAGDSVTIGDPDASPRYAVNAVTEGSSTIVLTTSGDAANFTEGGTLLLWSDTGYTDGGSEFKPAFQQIAGILDITGGTITLEHPVYRGTPGGATMYATPGEDVTGREQGGDTGISRNVVAGNFSASSPDDSWMRFGGTYRSRIGPVWLPDTYGAVVMNGLAHSTLHVADAKFRRFLIDLAFFCHDSEVRVDHWRDDPAVSNNGDTLISVAEGSHDNDVYPGSGYAGQTTQRRELVFFGPGCSRNRLHPKDIGAASVLTVLKTHRPAASAMEYAGNSVFGGFMRVGACNHVVWCDATTQGDNSPLEVFGTRFKAGTINNNCVYATGSKVLLDCEIDGPAAIINVPNAAIKDIDLSRLRTSNPPSSYGITSGAQVQHSETGHGEGHTLGSLKAVIDNGGSINSTSFTARYTRKAKAGTFLDADTLQFEMIGTITGTAGTKTLGIRIQGSTTCYVVTTSGQTGAFHIVGTFHMINTNGQRMNVGGIFNGASLTNQVNASVDGNTTDIDIELGGFVANAADSITIDCVMVRPIRDLV